MRVLEPSALILLVFSVASLIAVLAAAVVTVGLLAGAWYHSDRLPKDVKPRGSRCANAGRRPKRSKDCPIVGRRKHR
jgi:hypothetical protein